MDLTELKSRLHNESYDHLGCESGPYLLAIFDFRVERVDGIWRVCDTERGEVVHTHLTTPDESVACDFWYSRISEKTLFLVGANDRGIIDRLEQELKAAGMKVWRNDIPQFNGPDDPFYRIFVAGADLLKAKRLIQGVGSP